MSGGWMRYQPELGRSILDRLTDHEPELAVEPVQPQRGSLNSVIDAMLRDLENLLNTRSAWRSMAQCNRHARASLLSYGSRDFSSDNPGSQMVRQQIRLEIVRLLMLFEPRLKNVTVRLDPVQRQRSLNFRIEATLQIEPVAVPTVFDTCFDINSGAYSVLT